MSQPGTVHGSGGARLSGARLGLEWIANEKGMQGMMPRMPDCSVESIRGRREQVPPHGSATPAVAGARAVQILAQEAELVVFAMRNPTVGGGAALRLMQIVGLLLASGVMALCVGVVLPSIGPMLASVWGILSSGARGRDCEQANSEDHGFHGISLGIYAPATIARKPRLYAPVRMNAL